MATLGATEFTELVVATLRKVEDKLADNVMLRHPTLDLLRDQMQSETGRALVVPLELGLDDSSSFTDKSGTFATNVSPDIMGAAEYQWCDPLVSHVRLRWKDLQENQGSQKMFDLVKTHIRNMEYSHSRVIVKAMHALKRVAPVATPALSTAFNPILGQFDPLDALISNDAYDDAPGAQAAFDVGGIDADTQPLWQANRIEIDLTEAMTIRQAFRNVENEVYVDTSGKNSITAIICGRDVFEEFVDSFDDKIVYTSFGEGQTHFREVKFGSIAVRLDPDCPPKRAYFLDKQSLYFRNLAGNFMKTQESQKIPGTLDYVTPLASVLALGVNERRANAVLLRPATAGAAA